MKICQFSFDGNKFLRYVLLALHIAALGAIAGLMLNSKDPVVSMTVGALVIPCVILGFTFNFLAWTTCMILALVGLVALADNVNYIRWLIAGALSALFISLFVNRGRMRIVGKPDDLLSDRSELFTLMDDMIGGQPYLILLFIGGLLGTGTLLYNFSPWARPLFSLAFVAGFALAFTTFVRLMMFNSWTVTFTCGNLVAGLVASIAVTVVRNTFNPYWFTSAVMFSVIVNVAIVARNRAIKRVT